jgi:hypothetical protein
MSITEFLSAFEQNENLPMCFERIRPKGYQKSFEKEQIAFYDFWSQFEIRTDANIQKQIRDFNHLFGMYFAPNRLEVGKTRRENVTKFNAFFCESDDMSLAEQHANLNKLPLQPSIRVETLKSVHAYWLIDGMCEPEQWTDVQLRLIKFFKADEKIKNPNRVMRLPFLNHVSIDQGQYIYKKVQLVEFDKAVRYSVEEMQEVLPAVPKPKVYDYDSPAYLDTWEKVNQELRWRISQHPTYHQKSNGWAECKGLCHDGKSNRAIQLNLRSGAVVCLNGCHYEAVLSAFRLSKPEPRLNARIERVERTPQTSALADWFYKAKEVENNYEN